VSFYEIGGGKSRSYLPTADEVVAKITATLDGLGSGAGAATVEASVHRASSSALDVGSFSGTIDVVTDADRAAAATWGTAQATGLVDTLTVPGGLGIYAGGQNRFRRGQCDATTDYTALSSATIATDATTPPPYSPQSIKVTPPGSVSGEGVRCDTANTFLIATQYVQAAVWLKGVAGHQFNLKVEWLQNDATLATGAVTLVTATGSWQRVMVAPVRSGSGVKRGKQMRLYVQTAAASASPFWVAHPQIEFGSAVTGITGPYQPTSGGAEAAALGAFTTATVPNVIDPAQGWAAFRAAYGGPSSVTSFLFRQLFEVGDQADTFGGLQLSLTFDNTGFLLTRFDAVDQEIVTAPLSAFAEGDLVTVVAAWDASTLKLSVNGAAFVTVASTTIPDLSTFETIHYANYGGSEQFQGRILWGAFGASALTDADAAAFAALGSTPGRADLPQFPSALVVGETLTSTAALGAATKVVADGQAAQVADFVLAPSPVLEGGETGITLELRVTAGDSASPRVEGSPFTASVESFPPYAPPAGSDDFYLARLPFFEAQRELGKLGGRAGSPAVATVGWHGTLTTRDRGSFAAVPATGKLADLLGKRVKITVAGTSVYAFVALAADVEQDITVSRRLFQELAVLGNRQVTATVEVVPRV
jgi:hypothetical protein